MSWWLVWAIVLVAVLCVLLALAALARCTLRSFRATAGMRSAVSGPDAHTRVVAALVALPGVRVVDRSSADVLLSVLPAPLARDSMDRGWGLYVLVRPVADGVLLLARRRVPFPGGDVRSALRHLERAARRQAATGPSPFADS